MAPSRAQSKASVRTGHACMACAQRKCRCTGDQPCSACKTSEIKCEYAVPQRRGPKKKQRPVENHSNALPKRNQTAVDEGHASDAAILNQRLEMELEPAVYLQDRHQQSTWPARASAHSAESAAALASKDPTWNTDEAAFAARLFEGEGPHLSNFTNLIPQLDEAAPLPAPVSLMPSDRHPSLPSVLKDSDTSGSNWNTPENSLLRSLEHASSTSQNAISTAQSNPNEFDLWPKESESHDFLYRVYWCYVHPLWPIIYRPAFEAAATPSSRSVLHYAMMAIACIRSVARDDLSPSGSRPSQVDVYAGEAYFRQAQEGLDTTNFNPSIPVVQALLLMSLREIARGQIQQAWQHFGIASRMAIELDLHSANSTVALEHAGSTNDQERSRVIWGCYLVDTYFSVVLGRPVMLRSLDIDASLPSHLESDEYCLWHADAKGVLPNEIVNRFVGHRAHTMTNFNAWITLATILERVINGVYHKRRSSQRQRVADLHSLDAALQTWKEQYPACLGPYSSTNELNMCTPHVLYVRLWYEACCLILHRPFIPVKQSFPRGVDNVISSYKICTEAAESIGHLVSAYVSSFGVHRLSHAVVFIIFQSGVMHVANLAVEDRTIALHGHEQLQQCIRWLDQIGTSYDTTNQYRHVLLALEKLGHRAPKPSDELTCILASRPASRASSSVPLPLDREIDLPSLNFTDAGPIPGDTYNPLDQFPSSFWDARPLTNFNAQGWASFVTEYSEALGW